MVPKPPDWGAHIDVTGYLFLNESKLRTEGYTPPQDLADFLAAGPPPVYIGVSSPSAAAAFGMLHAGLSDCACTAGCMPASLHLGGFWPSSAACWACCMQGCMTGCPYMQRLKVF